MSKQKLGRGLDAILSPLTANKQSENAGNFINIGINKLNRTASSREDILTSQNWKN